MRAADERPADFPRAASVARIAVSASYVDAAVATVQLHGGIGFTWEHDAHLYHKNAISQHALFGGPGEMGYGGERRRPGRPGGQGAL